MSKSVWLIFSLLVSGTFCAAQSPAEIKNEFFAGYSFHSADINTLTVDPHRTSQNGVDFEYTRYLTKSVGITGDVSGHFHRDSQSTGVGTFESKRDQYYVLAGLQFKRRNENRVQPFVHALAGVSLFRGFTSNVSPTGNVFTIDDATGFAMALGGGLDVRANQRFDVRLIQAEFTPTRFGSGWQNNFRVSVGIVIKR